MILMPKF